MKYYWQNQLLKEYNLSIEDLQKLDLHKENVLKPSIKIKDFLKFCESLTEKQLISTLEDAGMIYEVPYLIQIHSGVLFEDVLKEAVNQKLISDEEYVAFKGYSGEFRVCAEDDILGNLLYNQIRKSSCDGFADVKGVLYQGKTFNLGFNYGH